MHLYAPTGVLINFHKNSHGNTVDGSPRGHHHMYNAFPQVVGFPRDNSPDHPKIPTSRSFSRGTDGDNA